MIKIISCIVLTIFLIPQVFGQERKESYDDLVLRIHETRDSLYQVYKISDRTNRDSIILFAKQFVLNSIINDIFEYWYGTQWEFYGQTRFPGEGSIACGYFVTAVLSDVGFNIPRVEWAQSASEYFIKKMSSDIKRFSNRPISDVKTYINKREDGLYMVGLDYHVGFIFKKDELIKFVHSNYYKPSIGVMAEDLDAFNPLNDSKYRVVGSILNDDSIIKWLSYKRIE